MTALCDRYKRVLKSEKGSSHVALLNLMLMLLATPFVGIALLFMGYKLYVYRSAPPEERAEMPWWPREFVTGFFLSVVLCITAFVVLIFTAGGDAQTRPIAGVLITLPFILFFIGSPVVLVQWRRRLPEPPSIWAVWGINTALVLFVMLDLLIVATIYSRS